MYKTYTVLIFAVALLASVDSIHSAKILGVFPTPFRSHHLLGSTLMKALAERGHDVTLITPFEEVSNTSYRSIVVKKLKDCQSIMQEVNLFQMGWIESILLLPFFINAFLDATEKTLADTEVQKFLNSGEHFDVVILDHVMNEAHTVFADHFEAPLILFSSIGTNPRNNILSGNPTQLSYVPDIVPGFPPNMVFHQRLVNTVWFISQLAISHLYIFPRHSYYSKKYFPKSPNLQNFMYNASLILVNAHPTINQPVPYIPNIIDIGGYHLNQERTIPLELGKILDGATNGVIFFSFGTIMLSSQMSLIKRQAFLNTFSKLNETVLWKWEEDTLPGQPPNVYISKWLPQQQILAHPNVRLFIGHGGLLSMIETIHNGVPLLAITVNAEQKTNAKRMIQQEFGLELEYNELTENSLFDKINELLNNQKYVVNIKMRSQFFNDRTVTAMDTAIYWIEYVIRHRGAPHLRVDNSENWYLDEVFVLSVLGLFLGYVLIKLFKSFKTRL